MQRIFSQRLHKTHFWDSLNVLRAGILGANDGIISVSGIVLGAVGADLNASTLFISGLSGMLAGACSMAGGEWISVSAQHDVQTHALASQATSNTPGKLNLHSNDFLIPLHAAAMSFMAFICGALIPLLAISLSSARWRVVNTALAMMVALSLNAIISTAKTDASTGRTIIRNVVIGVLTILVTYAIGLIFHVSVSA